MLYEDHQIEELLETENKRVIPVELLCSKVLLKLAAATVDEVEGEGLTGDEQLMLA